MLVMPPKGIQTPYPEIPVTRERARQLVKSIADKHGHLGEEVLGRMTPEVRRQVEDAMLRKNEMIASSVVTLSKNLYNSSARFVFELLQNADDNSYSIAKSHSIAPFVSFRVYPQRIVVECNEDGFTRENLIAICDVGKSSKAGAQGYIGEKGIGFKSVFIVAWKVHIQSGNFSFSFQHRKGDSGMGMVSPVWEDTDETLPYPLTRITLFLHETGTDEILDKQHETTLQQFRELQATFLLFMNNLRRIKIQMYDDHDEQISSTTFSMENQQQNRVELRRETVEGGRTQEHSQYYHVTKGTASDLPRSENRTYTDAELSRRAYAEAGVVLAFPLTHDSIPIIKPQDVFAFLPIRKMGFSFLIQSDFVTDASRQDIVRSSARNGQILVGVAKVFLKAVSQFCEHPSLRYQWMRYLPSDRVQSGARFWITLIDEIRSLLEITPTIWTKSHSKQLCIKDMRRVPSLMLDKNGEPLFPDSDMEQYPASEYLAKNLDLLKGYGLRWMSTSDFLAKVRQDLDQGNSSIMKSPSTDDGWHSQVAKVLISAWPKYIYIIRELPLIPLLGGKWVSSWKKSVSLNRRFIYYSHVNGYPIPTNLKLRLVDPQAERNADRKKLFGYLGVQEPQAVSARRMVIRYYRDNFAGLKNSQKHLEFLYLTAHLDRENDNVAAYFEIDLVDHLNRERAPGFHDFYFPDDDPYCAQQLLQTVDSGASHNGHPDLDVSILHYDYMRDCPTQPLGETRTWRTWLSEKLQIRDAIPLTRSGRLSEECLYVAKHFPEKFLGFLLKHWKPEEDNITKNQAVRNELLKLKVLCENGNMYPLGNTYIHAAQLQYADGFLKPNEFFPWIKQEPSLSDSQGLSNLEVVAKALGFGYPKSELEFYLTILRFIDGDRGDEELEDPARVFDLYNRIEARYQESATPDISRQIIREAFNSQFLIYVPGYGDEAGCWTTPDNCVWEAPADMILLYPLKSRYRSVKNGKYITEFFQKTLGIRDANVEDFLNELKELMHMESERFDHIYNLYQRIDVRLPDKDVELVEKVRETFENHALIYHENDGFAYWYKPSQCLWSTVTDIKGKVALNGLYEDLRDFFVERLGVTTLTLDMVYDKLVEQGERHPSVSDVKDTICLLNSYLQDEEELPSPEKLKASKVFPVKCLNGTVKLCSSAKDFAIADRKHLSDLFSGKANFLDYGVNEIPRLEPFLRWAGLEGRYLSSSVKEISALCGDSQGSLTLGDRNIALKAHGLLRIAVHFRSPRAMKDEHAFYEQLKKISVCETDGITSELHLNQGGKDIKVEVSKSELHFQEKEDGGLTIYVPRDAQAQYLCFLDRIPEALLEWIVTEPSTRIREPLSQKAINVMHMVLQAQNKYVASALDRAGIMSVDIPDDSTNVEPQDETTIDRTSIEQDSIPQAPSDGGRSNSAWTTMASTLYESSVVSVDVNEATAFSRGSRTPSRAASRYLSTAERTPVRRVSLSSGSDTPDETVDPQYLRLLNNVVSTARRSVFPSRGPFDMAALRYSLDAHIPSNDRELFRLRESQRIERDKKIGAAGELFVFEVLYRLDPALPNFSRSNWASTIRSYVSLHDDYTNLEPWNGRETADITYTDSYGVLTSLLIDKGYLCPDSWAGRRPRYFIEVKSTTLPWETPFYMSKDQYRRMQSFSQRESDPGSGNQDTIYVIFRVFNLGKDSAGMKVYVDPEIMREREELSFTAEKWSIVPGPRFGDFDG